MCAVNSEILGKETLAGIKFQRDIEEKAYKLGGGNLLHLFKDLMIILMEEYQINLVKLDHHTHLITNLLTLMKYIQLK